MSPEWIQNVKKEYRNCRTVVSEGQKILGYIDLNRDGVIEAEYDLKIRDNVFSFIDRFQKKIPPFILLNSTLYDLGPYMGMPQDLTLIQRTASFFITSTHETYNLLTSGDGPFDPKFHPDSAEFIGLKRARNIPGLSPVTIRPAPGEFLCKGEIQSLVEKLLESIPRYLDDSEKETDLYPLRERITFLEAEKDLEIAQGLQDYGRRARNCSLAFYEALPSQYTKLLPPYLDLNITVRNFPIIKHFFFVPKSKELILVPQDASLKSKKGPDFSQAEVAPDPDWFHYSLRLTNKLLDYLPKALTKDMYLWYTQL